MKYIVYVEISDLTGRLEFEVEANSEEEADRKGRELLIGNAVIWSEEYEDYGGWEDDDDDTSWLEEGEEDGDVEDV